MKSSLLAPLCAMALTGSAAATDEEILALYQESGTAWAEGRIDDADRAGEAAWRQAEQEWGASDDTAVLADNLVRQRLARNARAAAEEPAARVLELTESGAVTSISREEARLAVALSTFDPAMPTEDATRRVEAALEATEAGRIAPGQLIWTAWLDVARGRAEDENWDDAFKAGANVMNVMDLVTGVPDAARVEAAMISALAALEEEEFADAARSLSWGMDYVPKEVMVNGETVINPDWAFLGAWQGYASAVRESRGDRDQGDPGKDIFGLDEMQPEDTCPDVTWIDRGVLGYPSSALNNGVVGAVVVKFELAEDGSTRDVKAIAEVPDGVFADYSEKSVSAWRADPETVGACRDTEMTTIFKFVICTSASCRG